MNEHDIQTVACATVWLDTSNDVPARPGARGDDIPTSRARRRPAAAPHTDAHPTLALYSTAAGETARAASPLATQERAMGTRTRTALGIAKATARVAGAAMILTAAFGLGRMTARGAEPERAPRQALAADGEAALAAAATGADDGTDDGSPATATLARAASSQMPGRAPGQTPDQAPFDTADVAVASDATPARAVEALARGEYARALALYRALAALHPHDAAYAAIVDTLARKIEARCAPGATGSCDG